MSSEIRIIIKCLEWYTELPTRDCTRKSHVFFLNGNECYFKFDLVKSGDVWYYDLYLELTSSTDFKPCNGRLEVGFKNEQTLSICNKQEFKLSEPGSKRIWDISLPNLQPKLPLDYVHGNWIKFLVYFENMSQSFLQLRKDVEEKCTQTGSFLNTEVHTESMSEDFSRLLELGPKYDTEIKCGDQSIKAHNIILSTRSEVFKAMLESDMLEGQTGVVEIHDMDIGHIQDFVKYIYTGVIPELTFEKAKVLYEAGDKYAIRSLMLRCSEFLQENLSPENYLQCFALSDAHSDQKLKDRIILYILEKKIYLQEELWLDFCKTYPETALEVYRLSYKN